jgi:hypothetical protein
MKATGIVRRIDDYVIIGPSSESPENTVVSLILSNFANKWREQEQRPVTVSRSRGTVTGRSWIMDNGEWGWLRKMSF